MRRAAEVADARTCVTARQQKENAPERVFFLLLDLKQADQRHSAALEPYDSLTCGAGT